MNKQNLIKTAGRIPIIKSTLKLLFKEKYKKYKSSIFKEKNKIFNLYALETLTLFDKSMQNIGVEYTLAFGTMLGAIREKGFIKHDLDIDTYIWIEDFSHNVIKELQNNGFKWLYNYSIDNDKFGREDTFSYKGVNIDVFYIYPKVDKYPYCCDFVQGKGVKHQSRIPRRIEFPINKERKLVDFENTKFYIPKNAEELCEFRYGPNFMVPNPEWSWVSEKNIIIEWHEKIGVTKKTTMKGK